MSLKGVTCLKIEESLDQAANRTITLPRISNLDSQDLDVNNGVSIANPNSLLGARQKDTNSQSSSESVIPSGPPDTGIYKRFNEKEQKEREKVAENWIPAVIKKRLESHRKAPGNPIQVFKKETFLYEYAVYQKERYFVSNIKDSIAGMVVRQPDFTCCTRGTTEAGNLLGTQIIPLSQYPWIQS